MQETPFEPVVCAICDYWWAILLVVVLGLAAYFTRASWLPLLGS